MTFIGIVIGVAMGYFLAALIFGASQEMRLDNAYKTGYRTGFMKGRNTAYKEFFNDTESAEHE